MARVLSRSAEVSARGPSRTWRATRAVGGAVLSPFVRFVRKLAILALVIGLLILFVSTVITRARTPGVPSRVVVPSAGVSWTALTEARGGYLTVRESDLTAAFQRVTAAPTMPFQSGQVVVQDSQFELHGRLKGSGWTATVRVVPSVRNGDLVLALQSLTIGRQPIPRWLAGVLSVGSVDQLAAATNAVLPPLSALALTDGQVRMEFL